VKIAMKQDCLILWALSAPDRLSQRSDFAVSLAHSQTQAINVASVSLHEADEALMPGWQWAADGDSRHTVKQTNATGDLPYCRIVEGLQRAAWIDPADEQCSAILVEKFSQ